jgi:hypothetical protein
MLAKIIVSAFITGVLFTASIPLSIAGEPKTKAQCESVRDMKWNEITQTCIKK